jgi:hypothetical protein
MGKSHHLVSAAQFLAQALAVVTRARKSTQVGKTMNPAATVRSVHRQARRKTGAAAAFRGRHIDLAGVAQFEMRVAHLCDFGSDLKARA